VHRVYKLPFIYEIWEIKMKSLDQTCLNYAISALRGAINMYHHYREKGYSEDKSIDIAVKYMWGVITSSGVLTNPRLREKFLFNLAVIESLLPKLQGLISLASSMRGPGEFKEGKPHDERKE